MADQTVVKSEAVDSPVALDDDDLYEDAGDLEFYDANAPGNQFGTLYLARVPKALWEAWDKLDDDAEIQVGTIRQWYEKGPGGQPAKPRMKLLLNSDLSEHQLVPKEYNLDIGTTAVSNTFVFTEEDLPGFKAKSKARADAANMGFPASILRPRAERVDKPTYDRRSRFQQPYYRKAIPKKTKLFGKISYELNCAPIGGDEQRHLLLQQSQEELNHKKVQILERRTGQVVQIGTNRAVDWESNFIKSQPKPTKAKKQELKTARIPENELLDQLFECFAEFQYWGMRSLRQRLQQPEAYLRQTLEKIAFLNKAGRFANLWSLKAENVLATTSTAADVAPDTGDADTDLDGDDEDIKMEDVLP